MADNSWTNQLNPCGNEYFNPLSANYDGEREVYKILQMEAYNLNGLECEYFVVDFDKTKDPLFAEDTNQAIIRGFDFSGYTKLTQELENQTMFGLWGNDDLLLEISQMHFETASTLHYQSYVDDPDQEKRHYDGTAVYDSMVPRSGDLFKLKYNDRYYEVTDVRQSKNQFRLDQHTWTVFARVYMNKNYQIEQVVFDEIGNQGPQGSQSIWKPARDEYNNLISGSQGPQAPQGYQGALTQEGNQMVSIEFENQDVDKLEINDEIIGNQYDNIDDVLENW